MSKHEFTDVAPKKNIVYSFKIEMFKGTPLVAPKTSLVALDFIAVIKQSAKANELMQTATYAFEFDKQFRLNVSITDRVVTEEEATEAEPTYDVTYGICFSCLWWWRWRGGAYSSAVGCSNTESHRR